MKLRYKINSVIMLLSFAILLLFIPSFEGATQHFVTDTYSGESFVLNENGSEITLNTNNSQSNIYIDCKIVDICCFDKTFTFLCITETAQDNFIYTVYVYDDATGQLSSFATDCVAQRSNGVFTADGNGNVYILNLYDSSVAECYKNGTKTGSIKCNGNIVQMMCVAKDSVLLFTVDGVYQLKDHSLTKISSLVPVSPCSYAVNGVIIDNAGNKYFYKNNFFEIYKEEPTHTNEETGNACDIVIDHHNKYIYLSHGTTINSLLSYLGYKSENIIFKNAEGNIVTSGKLGTDMKISAETTTYTLIVKGDLTGEGNVNSRDLKAIMKHLTEEAPLSTNFRKAADLDEDNVITTKDMLALARMY